MSTVSSDDKLMPDCHQALHAAERISARFVLAGWGYGTPTVRAMVPHVELVARPEDLLQMIEEAG